MPATVSVWPRSALDIRTLRLDCDVIAHDEDLILDLAFIELDIARFYDAIQKMTRTEEGNHCVKLCACLRHSPLPGDRASSVRAFVTSRHRFSFFYAPSAIVKNTLGCAYERLLLRMAVGCY